MDQSVSKDKPLIVKFLSIYFFAIGVISFPTIIITICYIRIAINMSKRNHSAWSNAVTWKIIQIILSGILLVIGIIVLMPGLIIGGIFVLVTSLIVLIILKLPKVEAQFNKYA
jgi:hypothetical protein